MAVTSIWRVNGWLGKVVIYIENPEKTTNPKFYQSDAITDHQCQGLEDVISYAINSDKTKEITEILCELIPDVQKGFLKEQGNTSMSAVEIHEKDFIECRRCIGFFEQLFNTTDKQGNVDFV